jgi:hypothetical protein
MATKDYRLKVRKIPLPDDIIYRRPNFPPFQELHLDLLENKTKLRKSPPKPFFVYAEPPRHSRENFGHSSNDRDHDNENEDFTLDELEKAYRDGESDNENVFSDHEDAKSERSDISEDITRRHDRDHDHDRDSPREHQRGEYQQQYFQQEQEEQEDEEEREQREKAELLFKFMILRRQYPNAEIPEFTEFSDMGTMKRVYDQIIRRVALDSSVDDYKQYLVGGFMVMEWVSTNWLGFDLSGFTQQQTKIMNKYDRLLIELGEKNHTTIGSRFPVEVRLIFLVIFQAGLFYVQKMVFGGGMNAGGGAASNPFGMFGAMGGGAPSGTAAPKQSRRRGRGMRGPTISPDDIEEHTRRDASGSSSNAIDSDSDE